MVKPVDAGFFGVLFFLHIAVLWLLEVFSSHKLSQIDVVYKYLMFPTSFTSITPFTDSQITLFIHDLCVIVVLSSQLIKVSWPFVCVDTDSAGDA